MNFNEIERSNEKYWLFQKFRCVCSPYNQNYFDVIKSLSELQNIFDSTQMRSHPLRPILKINSFEKDNKCHT